MKIVKKISVLHIISGDLWAGAETMAYHLLSGLKQSGEIDIQLIILKKGKLERLCRKIGIKCYLIDESKLSPLAIAERGIKVARKIGPSIIHSHRYKENILATFIACFYKKVKLVATQHGRVEVDYSKLQSKLIDKLNNLCLNYFYSRVIAVSCDTKDYLLNKYGIKQNKLMVINNGIQCFNEPKQTHSRNKRLVLTIGSAGRLFPVKRFDSLIKIAGIVRKEMKDVQFIIAGHGPERGKLDELISFYGLEDTVRLLGHVDDMNSFYDKIDLYINTSLHEGLPMSILEAMYNRLPVIAFGLGGLKEIVKNNSDGFIIPKDDNMLFAYKILELLRNTKKLTDFGTNAHLKIINQYSAKRMVEEYFDLYKRVSLH
jgi:glycosyltransferase involved in cell wall biosynthesis